ncbi:MAG: bile acid:sodium symporter [Gammaproteobacteria bacterium]
MHESHFLITLANWLVVVFVVSNMLALGMKLTIAEVRAPLRNVPLSLKALLANFVLVPLVAYLLVWYFHLEHGYALGLILLATAAGDPFVTKASQLAKGDPAHTVAFMVALQVITVLYMPIVLPFLLPGVKVDALEIAKPLIILMLIPLAFGFFVKARFEKIARLLSGPLDIFSSVVIAIALSMLMVLYFHQILATWGHRVILTALILAWAGFAFGYLLGGPKQGNRPVLALNTGIRGYSAALVVGVRNFPSEGTLVIMIATSLILCLVTMLPVSATILRRKAVAQAKT